MQPEYSIKFVGDKLQDGKVLYKMQIYDTSTKVTWIVEARFSHLRDIHKALELRFSKGELPDFPPKGWWYENQKPQFITKRKKELENYYNTLFKTSSVKDLPQLKQFIESQRPSSSPQPKPKPQPAQKKQNDKPLLSSNASTAIKTDQFNDVYQKSVQKFINLRNQEIEPPNDSQTKKKKNQFQKVKIEWKSTIIQGMKLPKSKVQNYVEFWTSEFFDQKRENQQQFLKEINNFDMGFQELRKSVAHNIVNRVIIVQE